MRERVASARGEEERGGFVIAACPNLGIYPGFTFWHVN